MVMFFLFERFHILSGPPRCMVIDWQSSHSEAGVGTWTEEV